MKFARRSAGLAWLVAGLGVGSLAWAGTAEVRVLDPARAKWYSDQGLQTVCPTQIAIELLEQAVSGQAPFEGVAG